MRPSSLTGMTITHAPNFLNDAWPMVHAQSWCGEFKPANQHKDKTDE